MLAYWDASLRCRFANRAYESWFGVSPEELIGRHMSELLGPLYELNLPYIEGALRGEPQGRRRRRARVLRPRDRRVGVETCRDRAA